MKSASGSAKTSVTLAWSSTEGLSETCKPDADIATRASTARILVIATREDLTIMRETRQLVGSSVSRTREDEISRPSLVIDKKKQTNVRPEARSGHCP